MAGLETIRLKKPLDLSRGELNVRVDVADVVFIPATPSPRLIVGNGGAWKPTVVRNGDTSINSDDGAHVDVTPNPTWNQGVENDIHRDQPFSHGVPQDNSLNPEWKKPTGKSTRVGNPWLRGTPQDNVDQSPGWFEAVVTEGGIRSSHRISLIRDNYSDAQWFELSRERRVAPPVLRTYMIPSDPYNMVVEFNDFRFTVTQ